jgi:hypothetical protein
MKFVVVMFLLFSMTEIAMADVVVQDVSVCYAKTGLRLKFKASEPEEGFGLTGFYIHNPVQDKETYEEGVGEITLETGRLPNFPKESAKISTEPVLTPIELKLEVGETAPALVSGAIYKLKIISRFGEIGHLPFATLKLGRNASLVLAEDGAEKPISKCR